ncbi:hypothetical protein HA520_19620 [Azotobacter chroococcum]|uniref:Uncharacterized protein n=1 Tax=Azotobacter chroococcum TaxID=353 RepID=A0AA44C8F3_9GAMM|nr:hypothetical protein [Azotobacter chroococcum]NHN79460.1 hypothetical protein [Azotobacter chroococcum]
MRVLLSTLCGRSIFFLNLGGARVKVYCDNGACPAELKELQKQGKVTLYMFKYENKNKYIKESGVPSKATWNDMRNYTWDAVPSNWSTCSESSKYKDIIKIVGLANKRVDILHLDSAYKTKCEIFMTNDKDDIWTHRNELEKLLDIRIFCISEISECVDYIAGHQN